MGNINFNESKSGFKQKYFIIIATFLIIYIKSVCFLGMLRTDGSSSINFKTAFFQVPPILAQLSFVIVFLSLAFFFKKGRIVYCMVFDAIISFMLLADIWYYRVNGTFLSFRHMEHSNLFNPLGEGLFNLRPIDLVFFLDFIILLIVVIVKVIAKKKKEKMVFVSKYNNSRGFVDDKRRWISGIVTLVLSIGVIALSHYNIDIKDTTKGQKMLFRIAWAPFQTMSNMSPIGYHVYDFYKYIINDGSIKLNSQDNEEISNWLKNNKEDIPDNNYFGMLKGKNLIAVQVESLENFVIGQSVYGQEITPNLNRLLKNSMYFNNIHEQNNAGTSSDADFMVNTSMLPIREGATVFEHPWANLPSLPKVLQKEGYNTIAAHPEMAGSWNWAEMHKGILEFNKIIDLKQFNIDEKIGLGLSDKSLFNQMADKLKNEKQPFYNFFVTLSSHGPFDMPEDKKFLNLPEDFDKTILGSYFQSVRYVDEQINEFVKKLEANGLLNNTVLMIYGDHTGVHKFYNDQLKDVNLEGDWWKQADFKIPYIIYNPEIQEAKFETSGGQIDFFPTISYLLGADKNLYEGQIMGRNLLNTNVSSSIMNSGELVGTPKDSNEENHVKNSLNISNKIIRGDYFKQK